MLRAPTVVHAGNGRSGQRIALWDGVHAINTAAVCQCDIVKSLSVSIEQKDDDSQILRRSLSFSLG